MIYLFYIEHTCICMPSYKFISNYNLSYELSAYLRALKFTLT